MFVGKYKLKMATVVYQQFSISLFFSRWPDFLLAHDEVIMDFSL